jgi:multidrug efflux pump subunit AcrB
VRSILVIRPTAAQGHLRDALLEAAIRFNRSRSPRSAMLGALFILDDPIFNGLAISLIFGILVSTLLTLVVIPVLYFVAYQHKHPGSPA